MTDHNDASRESSGAAVDRSRSSTNDFALAKPVSSSPELETLARLARAVIDAEAVATKYARLPNELYDAAEGRQLEMEVEKARHAFTKFSTPERILGLIAVAQQGAEDKARLDEIQSGAVRIEGRGTTRPCQYWVHGPRGSYPTNSATSPTPFTLREAIDLAREVSHAD